jgi:O-antigen/teichoic acid export membrane protein
VISAFGFDVAGVLRERGVDVKSYLPEGRFARNLGKLLSGNVVAQALPVLCTPLLSRFYSPAEFGEWGIFVGLLTITLVFATGRLDMAIVVPKDQRRAMELAFGLLALSFTSSLLVTLSTWLVGVWRPQWLGIGVERSIVLLAFLAGGSLWATSIRQGLNYWFYRGHQYGAASMLNIVRSVAYVLAALVWGLARERFSWVNGMIAATIAGEIAAIVYGWRVVGPQVSHHRRPRWKSVKATVSRFRHFTGWGIPGDLLNSLTHQVPLLVLSRYFDAFSVGQFVMARRVIYTPLGLLSKSTGDVFVAHASEQIRAKGECRRLFVTTFLMMSAISLPLFPLLAWLSPTVFPIVLGPNWDVAAQMAQPLSICAGLGFVSSTMSRLLQITGRQRLDFYWQLLLFCLVATASAWTVAKGGDVLSVTYAFALPYAACYVLYLMISYSVSRTPYIEPHHDETMPMAEEVGVSS